MPLPPEDAKKLAAAVPVLSVAISLLAMVISGVWFASHISSEVGEHERRLTALEISREARWSAITASLSSLQVELSGLRATIDAVKVAIERIQDRDDRHDRSDRNDRDQRAKQSE